MTDKTDTNSTTNMGLPRWMPWWLFLSLRTGLLPSLLAILWKISQ